MRLRAKIFKVMYMAYDLGGLFLALVRRTFEK